MGYGNETPDRGIAEFGDQPRGRLRMRSAMMLRWISEEPAEIVLPNVAK